MPSQTREDLKAEIMRQLCELAGAVEADCSEHHHAEWTAQSLHYSVREYFRPERWRPCPVFEGLRTHLPLNEALTLRFETCPQPHGLRWERGRLLELRAPYPPDDGGYFQFLRQRCRNHVTLSYHARPGARLTVWRGSLSEAQARWAAPIYDHQAAPPIDLRAEEVNV